MGYALIGLLILGIGGGGMLLILGFRQSKPLMILAGILLVLGTLAGLFIFMRGISS